MTRFVIYGIQRTGTNLITSMLDSHPRVNCLSEVFLMSKSRFPLTSPVGRGQNIRKNYLQYLEGSLFRQFRHATALTRCGILREYLDSLFAPSGFAATGFKLMHDQAAHLPVVIDYINNNKLSVIHIIRQNELKTYVSRQVSKTTGTYHTKTGMNIPKIHVPTETLIQHLDLIRESKKRCGQIFPNLATYHVSYESYCSEIHKENRNILSFLGISDVQPLSSTYVKITPDHLPDVVENYDEIKELLKNTKYEWCC